MSLQLAVESVTFSDGTQVSVPAGGVLVIVGPNSSGKSEALRNIQSLIEQNAASPAVVSIEMTREGSSEEFYKYMESVEAPATDSTGRESFPSLTLGLDQSFESIYNRLFTARGQTYFGLGHGAFCTFLDAGSRLNLTHPVSVMEYDAQSTISLHRLVTDQALKDEIDDVVNRAFGLHVTVDHFGGSRVNNSVNMRLGPHIAYRGSDGVPDRNYVQEIRRLKEPSNSGEGINAFIGIMMSVVANKRKFLFVDEPETFLHPPQARFLASELAKKLSNDRQLFVSTHSKDIILGLIDSKAPVTIVRLMRRNDINHAQQLSADNVKLTWNNAFLRHTNIMDGIFNDAVVVCEGDVDCQYYAAVMDIVAEKVSRGPDGKAIGRRPDVLFVSSSGKSKMAEFVSTLTALGVPAFAIPDIDVFRGGEYNSLRKALAPDADYSYADDLAIVRKELGEDYILEMGAYNKKLKDEVKKLSGKHPTDTDLQRFRDVFKAESKWEGIKKAGTVAMDQTARDAARRLIEDAKLMGLFIVPVGELESWVDTLGSKLRGAKWFEQVVAQDKIDDNTKKVQDFISELLIAIESRTRQDLI